MSSTPLNWQQILGVAGNAATNSANAINGQPSGLGSTQGMATATPMPNQLRGLDPNPQNPMRQDPNAVSQDVQNAMKGVNALRNNQTVQNARTAVFGPNAGTPNQQAAMDQSSRDAVAALPPPDAGTPPPTMNPPMQPLTSTGLDTPGMACGGMVERRAFGSGPVGGGGAPVGKPIGFQPQAGAAPTGAPPPTTGVSNINTTGAAQPFVPNVGSAGTNNQNTTGAIGNNANMPSLNLGSTGTSNVNTTGLRPYNGPPPPSAQGPVTNGQGTNNINSAGALQGATSAYSQSPSVASALALQDANRAYSAGVNNAGTNSNQTTSASAQPLPQNGMFMNGGGNNFQRAPTQVAADMNQNWGGGPTLAAPPPRPQQQLNRPLQRPMGRASGGSVDDYAMGGSIKGLHPVAKIKIQSIHPIRMTNPLGSSAGFAEGGSMEDEGRTDHIDPGTDEYETHAHGGSIEGIAGAAHHLRAIHHLLPKSAQPHNEKAHRAALDELHNAAFAGAPSMGADPMADAGPPPDASPMAAAAPAPAPSGGPPPMKHGGSVKKHKAGGGAISGKEGEEEDAKAKPVSKDTKVGAAPKKEGYKSGGYVDPGTSEYSCGSGSTKTARGMGAAKRGASFSYKKGGSVKK